MSKGHKIFIYAVGFLLGSMVVLSFQRNREPREPHPWHAQTAPDGYYPLTVEDALGRSVSFERQPRHFISLAPSVTEILFAMEMGDHLQAVSQWCDYPEQAKLLRDSGGSIGAMDRPDRELLISYRPDLVIGTTLTPPEIFQTIEDGSRIRTLALSHNDIDGVMADIALIGRATGVPGKSLALVTRLRAGIAGIEQQLEAVRSKPQPQVLFLLSIEDDLQPGWSAGEGTWPGDLLVRSHARNAAAALGRSWGQVSFEALLQLNPDIILVRDASSESGRTALRQLIERLPQHAVWGQVEAVRNGRIHILPYGPLNIPGPRLVDAYRSVSAAIWPELAAPQSTSAP